MRNALLSSKQMLCSVFVIRFAEEKKKGKKSAWRKERRIYYTRKRSLIVCVATLSPHVCKAVRFLIECLAVRRNAGMKKREESQGGENRTFVHISLSRRCNCVPVARLQALFFFLLLLLRSTIRLSILAEKERRSETPRERKWEKTLPLASSPHPLFFFFFLLLSSTFFLLLLPSSSFYVYVCERERITYTKCDGTERTFVRFLRTNPVKESERWRNHFLFQENEEPIGISILTTCVHRVYTVLSFLFTCASDVWLLTRRLTLLLPSTPRMLTCLTFLRVADPEWV